MRGIVPISRIIFRIIYKGNKHYFHLFIRAKQPYSALSILMWLTLSMRCFLFRNVSLINTFTYRILKACKEGEKVWVTGGEYASIEDELYRLKGYKRVVIWLGDLVYMAMGEYIANENLGRI